MKSLKIFIFWVFILLPLALGVYQLCDMLKTTLHLLPGVAGFYTATVPGRIALYLSGSTLLGVALLLTLFICKHENKFPLFFKNSITRTIILLFLLNLLIYWIPSPWIAVLPLLFWAVLRIHPLLVGVIPSEKVGSYSLTIPKTISFIDAHAAKIVLVLVCVLVFLLYLPKVFFVPTILNGFYRIPELYKLENGTTVSTTDIVNAFRPAGMQKKIDILTYKNWKDSDTVVSVPNAGDALEEIVSEYHTINGEEAKNYWGFIKSNFYSPIVVYRDGVLFVVWADGPNHNMAQVANFFLLSKLSGAIPEQIKYLKDIYNKRFAMSKSYFGTENKVNIASSNLTSMIYKFNTNSIDKNETPDAVTDSLNRITKNSDFFQEYGKNSISEFYWQINNRGEIKHQAHYLIPIHEYLIGKPLDRISHLYGLGMTIIGGVITKMFSQEGIIPYGVFYRVLASMCYLGFFVMLGCMYAIFKDYRLLSLCALLWLLNQFVLGFETYTLSSGVSELRTLFDCPVFYLAFALQRKKSWHLSLAMAAILLLAVFVSFEFGMMITIACMAAVACEAMRRGSITKLDIMSVVAMFSICGVGAYFHSIGVQGAISHYLLSGVLATAMTLETILLLFVPLFVYIFMYLHMSRENSIYRSIFIIATFYSQEVTLYYVWSGMIAHFNIFFLRYWFPAIFYFAFLFLEKKQKAIVFRSAFVSAVILIVIVSIAPAKKFLNDYLSYNKVFKSHVTYFWDTKNTGIRTTMNPKYFSNAVDLINKYIPKKEKGITLISQYDCLLPFLANKYSDLPYFDISQYLITEKEKDNVINRIKATKPEYIFVDSDINAPYEFDIVPISESGTGLHEESRMRVYTLNAIRDIFLAVKDAYTPIDEGTLITAYRRK